MSNLAKRNMHILAATFLMTLAMGLTREHRGDLRYGLAAVFVFGAVTLIVTAPRTSSGRYHP